MEPYIGQSDLIVFIKNKILDIIFDMYEIDSTIKLLDNIEINNTKNYIFTCNALVKPGVLPTLTALERFILLIKLLLPVFG